jgi:SpoVK/Ycf46/Vps4 family AAA+-type ATPase
VDAIAVKRGQENSPVQDRMLSQMLNELDGISPLNNVLFLCATNRPDIIVC